MEQNATYELLIMYKMCYVQNAKLFKFQITHNITN